MPSTELHLDGLTDRAAQLVERCERAVIAALPWPGGPGRRVRVVDHPHTLRVDGGIADDGCEEVQLGRRYLEALASQPDEVAAQQLSEGLVEQRLALRLSRLDLDDDETAAKVAAVFGPRFAPADVRAAIERPVPTSAEAPAHPARANVVTAQARQQLGVSKGSGMDVLLAAAWTLHLDPDERPHLSRALAPLVDDLLGIEVTGDVQAARATLDLPQRPRGWRAAPVQRDETGHSGAYRRAQHLAAHPDDVLRPGDEPDLSINDVKRELFEIMQVLADVANEDVQRFLDAGGVLDPGNLEDAPPLRAATSTLGRPEWGSLVARAAHLMSRTRSDLHQRVLRSGDPVQAVLGNFASGYSAVLGEQATVAAIEAAVLAVDPHATADELREIALRSKSLVTQKAGTNVLTLNATRAALSIPADSEGTYEPFDIREVDPSNLRYDPERRRVVYRKALSELQVPKAMSLYREIWCETDGSDVDVKVSDAVTDPLGSTVVLACPALTPMQRPEPAPIIENWNRLVKSNHRRWLVERPLTRLDEMPPALDRIVRSGDDVTSIEIADLPTAHVTVRSGPGRFWIEVDPELSGSLELGLDAGRLSIRGAGAPARGASQPEHPPRLVVHLPDARSSVDVQVRNVCHVTADRLGRAAVDVPSNGTAYTKANSTQLRLGEGAHVVAVTPNAAQRPSIAIGGDERGAPASATVIARGEAPSIEVDGTAQIEVSMWSSTVGLSGDRQWEVAIEDLPPGARHALDVAGASVRDGSLGLPSPGEALRNNLDRRSGELARRFVASGGALDRPASRVYSALLAATVEDPGFAEGLRRVTQQRSLTVPARNLLLHLLDVGTGEHDVAVALRAAYAGGATSTALWRSPALLATETYKAAADSIAGATATAADVDELRTLRRHMDDLEPQVQAALPRPWHDPRPGDAAALLDEIAACTTTAFDPAQVVAAAMLQHPSAAGELTQALLGSMLAPMVAAHVLRSPGDVPPRCVEELRATAQRWTQLGDAARDAAGRTDPRRPIVDAYMREAQQRPATAAQHPPTRPVRPTDARQRRRPGGGIHL